MRRTRRGRRPADGAETLRMAAEAHSMYLRVLMERCASLPVSDVLSALGSDLLDGATRLFSRFDADVDGLLSQAEFSHLYSFLSEQTTAAASASAAAMRGFCRLSVKIGKVTDPMTDMTLPKSGLRCP